MVKKVALGCRVWVQDSGAGFRVQGFGCREGSKIRVRGWGVGFVHCRV
jgi:hypothetical protein